MWKASCDRTLPSPVPFHSLQILLLLAAHCPVKAPVKLLGGGGALWMPCHFTLQVLHSLTGPVGQLFVSRLGGRVLGMHKLIMEPGFSCRRCLATLVTPMWSLITDYKRSSLLAVFAATLATLLVPILFSLQATDSVDIPLGSRKGHTHYWGRGSSVKVLHFSHFHHVYNISVLPEVCIYLLLIFCMFTTFV